MSFVRKQADQICGEKQVFGGNGTAKMHQILNGAEELGGKGRLFNQVFLEPGCEIGWHIHHGDNETYYILSGKGEYNDNGTLVEVNPGDVTFTDDGEGHAMKAIGDETLVMIALILYN